ncbi:hypothetical protein [Capnocytophaga cynodegmi]|uniref:hypothetical protein n=1 Tax=Capnocytophaga cynodegmi TaxID=28189 RepID=UPI00036A6120|nr:hypothetical protein [Capnocytophaga cynodegmi]CEN41928.1 hypothetical protein CCYN49044_60067 [Capnocytophaga cynodegmi]
MDIHNTESTNLLLASSEIKFYLTYKEFMDNYPNHLKKWLELQSPYGEEKDFKEEYLQIYYPFFADYGINGLDFKGFWVKYEVFEPFEPTSYQTNFFDISLYHDFLTNKTNYLLISKDSPAQILSLEYEKEKEVYYPNNQKGDFYFSYEVRRVLNTFFVWNEEAKTIIFKKNQYRNFTKNIEKIVRFLLSEELYTDNNPLSESNSPKKETLPLPVSEPKPQRTEPTQDPQPVPNFGEAQPAPVVSEHQLLHNFKEQTKTPEPQPFKKIQWHGTPREAMELIKALTLTGTLKDSIIDIVEVFNSVFEVVNNKNSKLTKENYSVIISKTTAPERKKQPKFLNKLIKNFEQPTPPKLLTKLKNDFKSIMKEEK